MRWRMVVALSAGAVGLIFLGQGLGLIPGSYMTGDGTWAVVGAVMIVIAGVVGWRARRQG
ncbi:MAG TPA: hypothetical protein VFT54_07405 [Acidimicrobiia bacterium]|nr:hypothetical protein [Acidimicrobiia bacterium]